MLSQSLKRRRIVHKRSSSKNFRTECIKFKRVHHIIDGLLYDSYSDGDLELNVDPDFFERVFMWDR